MHADNMKKIYITQNHVKRIFQTLGLRTSN